MLKMLQNQAVFQDFHCPVALIKCGSTDPIISFSQ